MSKLDEAHKDHLVKALQVDDPSEKNYHIRQVLQSANVTELPENVDIDGFPEKY